MPLSLNALAVRGELVDVLADALADCGLVPPAAGQTPVVPTDLDPARHPPDAALVRPTSDPRPPGVAVHRLGDGRVRAAWLADERSDRSGLAAALGVGGRRLTPRVWRAALIRSVRAHLELAGQKCGPCWYELSAGADTLRFETFAHEDELMKMPDVIRVTIDPQGVPKIEVVGGQGASCLTATKKLIDGLGAELTQELKPEFYQAPLTEEQVVSAGAT